MNIHDQSMRAIYEALLSLFNLCFLMTMFHNKSGIGSHAQLFLVDSAVIEYNIHCLGHDVVVVVRAQNPMMPKKKPPVRLATREYLNPSAGFAGDDKAKGKHCVFFMAGMETFNL